MDAFYISSDEWSMNQRWLGERCSFVCFVTSGGYWYSCAWMWSHNATGPSAMNDHFRLLDDYDAAIDCSLLTCTASQPRLSGRSLVFRGRFRNDRFLMGPDVPKLPGAGAGAAAS